MHKEIKDISYELYEKLRAMLENEKEKLDVLLELEDAHMERYMENYDRGFQKGTKNGIRMSFDKLTDLLQVY